MVDPLQITADEVNCLIYAYFKDSGFQHSAFVLRAESHLEHSPHFRKHVPRGELVELLSKALLFSEVEAHWKGDNMTLSCRNPFNILERHVCSASPQLAPPPPPLVPASTVDRVSNGGALPQSKPSSSENALKRKASGTPTLDEPPKEKRAKTSSPVEIDVESRPGPSVEPLSGNPQPPSASSDGADGITELPASKPANVPLPEHNDKESEDAPVQLLKAHKTEVFVCAWNPVNNSMLASGSRDSVVHLWNLPGPDPNGDIHTEIEPPTRCAYPPKDDQADLTSLDWSPDGSLLAIGCYDSVLRVCDKNGNVYFMHTQHDGPIFAARFSPAGRWLATASLDGSACIWDVQGKRLHRQYVAHQKCCLDVDWLSESEFATSGSDGLIQIMHVDNPKPLKSLSGHRSEVNQLRANPSRTRIASCSDDKTARVWNIEDIVHSRPHDDQVVLLSGHKLQVSNLAWSPYTASGHHELLVTTSFDQTARLWDSVTGQCLRVFHDHKSHVYNLAFSPDGRHFATAGGDGWMYVYEVESKQKKWSYCTGKRGIFELSWQKAGNLNRIAMALENRAVGVADLTRIPELQ
ncbi:WD40 repeat-like protein [Trametes coccinea BRFM310]|uniref:WD40 repeat-like protein n=1 Tax=Trametes coccinea (strain BRFM310) TaxID=1353009 RepID=A0A1Y2IPZ6_TRAC3|nr:WD40 repeat-like protein [Trametes coccinea BRFM310]